jgi:hypothetical protein
MDGTCELRCSSMLLSQSGSGLPSIHPLATTCMKFCMMIYSIFVSPFGCLSHWASMCPTSTTGKYPVIPYFKCSYDTIFQMQTFKCLKKLEKICQCSKDVCLPSLNLLEPNSKCTWRNKKDKLMHE